MAEKNTHGIVASDSVRKARQLVKLPSASVFMWAIGALVVLALLWGGWALLHRPEAYVPTAADVKASDFTRLIADAQTQADSDNYPGAQVILDNALKDAVTATDQGQLYEAKGTLAFNAQLYQDGISFGQKAETLHATYNSAYVIAINEEGAGDKKAALDYYQKALDRLPTTVKDHSPDIPDMYKQKIEELKKAV